MGANSNFSRYLRAIAVVACLAVVTCAVASDETPSIVVIYPNLGNEYNAVFESIADGVSDTNKSPVHRIPLTEDFSPDDLKKHLTAVNAHAVVALGRRGLNASKGIGWKGHIVYGGVIWGSSAPIDKAAGITLDPDPRAVFSHLKRAAPHVKRVHAIIDPAQGGWLIPRVRAAAMELGLIIEIKEITSHRAAAIAYRDLLKRINPSEDSLWLPLDPIDETTFKLILTTAWTKRFAVISSNPDHAQRGALYSILPDYPKIGRRLSSLLADQRLKAPTLLEMRPNTDVKLAVNLRTARHLGIEYSRETLATFEVVYR